jgi:nucleotide-binding universal stress UspA family protein
VFLSIVVGTDGSETATEAVRRASELARRLDARLHVVTAYQPVLTAAFEEARLALGDDAWMASPGEQAERVAREAAAIAQEVGVTADTHVRPGDAANILIEVAEDQRADLIAVGSKGLAGVARFLLGSVPSKVVHHAPCDVLIIRTT